jgi:hypothetical protein
VKPLRSRGLLTASVAASSVAPNAEPEKISDSHPFGGVPSPSGMRRASPTALFHSAHPAWVGEGAATLVAAPTSQSTSYAKVLLARRRKYYGAVRPHTALGCRPPAPEAILRSPRGPEPMSLHAVGVT